MKVGTNGMKRLTASTFIAQTKNKKKNCPNQECSQKGDSGCASEKLGVPHLLSD